MCRLTLELKDRVGKSWVWRAFFKFYILVLWIPIFVCEMNQVLGMLCAHQKAELLFKVSILARLSFFQLMEIV